ncbi:Adenylate cyclase type 2 [Dirofilaria immitis]|nr:Adenylate cyclase type 2 [Dirofilaria immitis]
MDMTDSRNSFEQNTTELLHNEIRNVLLRYWRNIDRVRLQFFHIWLIIFSILQIGLINYLMLQLISLSMDQIILIIIGAIEDANEAADRDNLSLRFNKAVNRQIELQALKDRQDQLLLSVIPAYLTEQVSKTVMKSFDNDDKEIESRNLFHEFHVQYHANVSILFADIVNFTVLAGRLSANELVYTLNELYSKFDQDAQKLQCMRIKFLGDCYYCVSGMPLNRPNHADMCVIMGLEMIKTVKQVRKATGVDVNMRIGVHTGSVLCGVLGLRKWQFDIWSDDVMLANRMETTGTPGAVHITNTTKELLLGQYNIIEAYSNDPILIALGQPTYYILPDETSAINRTTTYNRKMIANDEQNDNLTISQTFKIASFKSKISKRNYERNMEIACNASLRDEEKTVEELQNINKNLIENILPSHVAAKLLNSNQLTNKLYAQLHENVCVMFASIPNYEEFWGEWDRSKKFECLRFLNEIVCEFDKLLSELKFRNVEKIKTVASTYLAATGLDEHELIDTYSYRNVILMVEFAMEMNNILRKLNDHSFQNFELRVGLNCGPLIAGVIGAQKPQYDIWGDTVNLASRMDTYGESGKIHMTKAVGQLLQQSSLPVTSRGFMKVKGVAEPIETFFLEFKSAGVLAKNCTNYLC